MGNEWGVVHVPGSILCGHISLSDFVADPSRNCKTDLAALSVEDAVQHCAEHFGAEEAAITELTGEWRSFGFYAEINGSFSQDTREICRLKQQALRRMGNSLGYCRQRGYAPGLRVLEWKLQLPTEEGGKATLEYRWELYDTTAAALEV